jgi:hypothetical protein
MLCDALPQIPRPYLGCREQSLSLPVERTIMDLVTLVTACALVVDPKIMHALIWHQSGGEPWSFSVPGERQPQVYHTVRDAIEALRAVDSEDIAIRVGLTGLSANSRSATAAMFAPCPNITVAARQIAQLGERCKTIAGFKVDPIHCAIAAYRGSWAQPDNGFADAVRATVAKGDAPNFDMPKGTNFDFSDVGLAIPSPGLNATAAPTIVPDDRQRGWSSALFPAKAHPLDSPSTHTSMSDKPATDLQERDARSAVPMTAAPQPDGLFVPRSPERRPQ